MTTHHLLDNFSFYIQELDELKYALEFGCAVYIDFSNGDGMISSDARRFTASAAIGRRVVARAFQDITTDDQIVREKVNPNIFALQNVLHELATALHKKVFLNLP